jgi:hypothetical protein
MGRLVTRGCKPLFELNGLYWSLAGFKNEHHSFHRPGKSRGTGVKGDPFLRLLSAVAWRRKALQPKEKTVSDSTSASVSGVRTYAVDDRNAECRTMAYRAFQDASQSGNADACTIPRHAVFLILPDGRLFNAGRSVWLGSRQERPLTDEELAAPQLIAVASSCTRSLYRLGEGTSRLVLEVYTESGWNPLGVRELHADETQFYGQPIQWVNSPSE